MHLRKLHVKLHWPFFRLHIWVHTSIPSSVLICQFTAKSRILPVFGIGVRKSQPSLTFSQLRRRNLTFQSWANITLLWRLVIYKEAESSKLPRRPSLDFRIRALESHWAPWGGFVGCNTQSLYSNLTADSLNFSACWASSVQCRHRSRHMHGKSTCLGDKHLLPGTSADEWGPVVQWLVQRFRSERLRVRSWRSATFTPSAHVRRHGPCKKAVFACLATDV